MMFARFLLLASFLGSALFVSAQPSAPKEPTKLFNGKNLTGLTTWLKDTKRDDPRKVFTANDGILHLSGDGFGYVATVKEYKDYHLSVEYRWGKRTDGGKYVRNSGILLHATGPDGGAGGTWMSSIECQLAQGCVGDLIVIRGKDDKGDVIPVSIKAETALGTDKRPRWKAGGEVRTFPKGQLWWSLHEAGFKELLDTRGKDDLESKLGDWTKVECICKGSKIEILVNGTKVNEAFDVFPAAGKILLQTEGFEIDFRHFEVKPIGVDRPKEEAQLPPTSERLSGTDEKAVREAIVKSGPTTAGKPPQFRVLIVPKEIEAAYAKSPRATTRLLLKIVDGGQPWDSIHAIACIMALVVGPESGGIFARGANDKTWDDPIGEDRETGREFYRRACIRLTIQKENAKETKGSR